MGWKYRKSFKMSSGVKINLNKKSASITFGKKGAHYTVNTNGTKTKSIGIPGTGLYHTEVKKQSSVKAKRPASRSLHNASSDSDKNHTKQNDISALSNEQLRKRSRSFLISGIIMIFCAVLLFQVSLLFIVFLIIGICYICTSMQLRSELKKRTSVRWQLERIQADIQKRINERKLKGELKPAGIPSGKVVKQMTITPVGIMFDCLKGDFTRQDILINLLEGDAVSVEKYKYKSKDAYMLISNRLKMDFGVINASLAEEISEKYPSNKIEGYITKTDSFFADDKDENIYTCRVKLYVIEDR